MTADNLGLDCSVRRLESLGEHQGLVPQRTVFMVITPLPEFFPEARGPRQGKKKNHQVRATNCLHDQIHSPRSGEQGCGEASRQCPAHQLLKSRLNSALSWQAEPKGPPKFSNIPKTSPHLITVFLNLETSTTRMHTSLHCNRKVAYSARRRTER